MTNKPIVSILTTVYNREKYLADCIESVLASSFSNWEMIIVDDQSQDNSVEIAQKYAAKDQRIKLHVNPKNLGDYPNRNHAASFAQGKYLKYLDADDLIYPYGLEIMVENMEQFPQAALGVSQKVAEDKIPFPFILTPKQSYYREFMQRGVLGFPPTMAIIRKEVFIKLNGFSDKRYIGDTEFWLRLARKHNVLKIQPDLVFWREHDEQEYKKGMISNDYLINNYLLSMKMLNLPDCPLDSLDILKAKKTYKKRLTRNLIRLLLEEKSISKVNEIKKAIGLSWIDLFRNI